MTYRWFKAVMYGATVAMPLAVTLHETVGCVSVVSGASMQPTFNPDSSQQDKVFLNKWAVRNFEVERGDIVALTSPTKPDENFIKRIVGLEGDVIRPRKKDDDVHIPKGHCWVEGDNVARSVDSNKFGPVPVGLVYAKATAIVWPPSRIQKLETRGFHDDRYYVKQNPNVTLFQDP